jgi:alpha-beta hydrolase superfamily lysophospholipase
MSVSRSENDCSGANNRRSGATRNDEEAIYWQCTGESRIRRAMPKTEDRRKALELFKPPAVVQPEEDPVAEKMARQRAARLARNADGQPLPEPDPEARVAKRR